MTKPVKNTPASIRTRLLNHAQTVGDDYNLLVQRYAIERLLYRLGSDEHGGRFVLKGAMLFTLWNAQLHRPTRDLDLLGFGEWTADQLRDIFTGVCSAKIEPDDGLTWDAKSLDIAPIREGLAYGGERVRMVAMLDGMRIPVQIDIGFGDAISPQADQPAWTCLLGFPSPKLRTYPPETVVAEKYHAMATLGLLNTRMKDYFDLLWLAHHRVFDTNILATAIAATFARRKTAVPADVPNGLSEGFAHDATKQLQWNAFLRKNKLEAPPLPVVIAELRTAFWPAMAQAST